MAGIVMNQFYASGADGDIVLTRGDPLKLRVSSIAPRTRRGHTLSVVVRSVKGTEIGRKTLPVPALPYGVSDLGEWSPRFTGEGLYFIEYELRQAQKL